MVVFLQFGGFIASCESIHRLPLCPSSAVWICLAGARRIVGDSVFSSCRGVALLFLEVLWSSALLGRGLLCLTFLCLSAWSSSIHSPFHRHVILVSRFTVMGRL
ncbi:unnamed protein product [Linum tenue]|uniref:Secreted protein n=1 Tax=Linum tenue TaxID=586396 RepID=A0AAV0HB95_9ROSI|nr:unnamed protein product [Linum tenue]